MSTRHTRVPGDRQAVETAIAPLGVEPIGVFAEELATFEESGQQSGAELVTFAHIMQKQRKNASFLPTFPLNALPSA